VLIRALLIKKPRSREAKFARFEFRSSCRFRLAFTRPSRCAWDDRSYRVRIIEHVSLLSPLSSPPFSGRFPKCKCLLLLAAKCTPVRIRVDVTSVKSFFMHLFDPCEAGESGVFAVHLIFPKFPHSLSPHIGARPL